MDLEMAGLETAVLPAVHQVYSGDGVETAVLWQHGFRNGRIGNGRFARSLRKLARWWVETAILPAAYEN